MYSILAELHDEKNQPDMKNMQFMSMPLDEFTDAAWAGLVVGKESIPVGTAQDNWDAFEVIREKRFRGMVNRMKGK